MKSVMKSKNYFPTVNVMIVDSDISQQIKFLLFPADAAVPIVTPPKHWLAASLHTYVICLYNTTLK